MGLKGSSRVYLLTAALATVCLSGCVQWEYQRWHGPIPLHTISAPELVVDTYHSRVVFTLEILSIQRIGTDEVFYPPAGERKTLWLKPGQYRAKVTCTGKPGDVDFSGIAKPSTAVGEDQAVEFTLKLEPEGATQNLECVIDNDGRVFAGIVEGIQVVIDD